MVILLIIQKMIKIVDNFFPDPYLIRRLGLEEKKGETFIQTPGQICEIKGSKKDLIFNIIKKQLPEVTSSDRMAFNFINDSYCGGMCHSDNKFDDYTCINFLIRTHPANSGIEIFDKYSPSKKKLINGSNEKKESFNKGLRTPIDRYFYKRVIDKVREDQDNKIEVNNKFNRMVIFPSERIHRAQNYFGKERKDSRLTFITFLGYR